MHAKSDEVSQFLDKYLLLAAIEPRLIFIVINSGERELVKTNPRWHAAQVPLLAAHYDFLEHDSVIDCTNAQEMNQEEVERQLIQDMTRIKGRLSQTRLLWLSMPLRIVRD